MPGCFGLHVWIVDAKLIVFETWNKHHLCHWLWRFALYNNARYMAIELFCLAMYARQGVDDLILHRSYAVKQLLYTIALEEPNSNKILK